MNAWSRFLDAIGVSAPNPAPIPVAPEFLVSNADDALRWKMAHQIFIFERELDTRGHLAIQNLPANDGGGAREVAGINMRYDGPEEAVLEKMVKSGLYDEAEQEATKYILSNTNPVTRYCQNPAIEFYLRDIYFNRGPGACIRILQKAIGVKDDGSFGPITESTEKAAESEPSAMLDDLYKARVWWEHDIIGARSGLDNGLMNRFQSARAFSKTLI